MKTSVKLDPSRLLGLRMQATASRGSKLGIKQGPKLGQKFGPKLGVKEGAKLGYKATPARLG